jgi:hypothetical protein
MGGPLFEKILGGSLFEIFEAVASKPYPSPIPPVLMYESEQG